MTHVLRSVSVRVDILPEGRLRVSTPYARGWAAVVSHPIQLAAAISEAFREAEIAGYARWKGEAYDLDALVDVNDPLMPAPRTIRFPDAVSAERRFRRTDVHSPLDWAKLPNGRWRSPSGRTYRPDSEAVRLVREKLDALRELNLVPPDHRG